MNRVQATPAPRPSSLPPTPVSTPTHPLRQISFSSIPMDSALTELPFFPEKFIPSRLVTSSSYRVNDLLLPPRPPSVCEACWKGPFAAHLGLFHPRLRTKISHVSEDYEDGGFSYLVSGWQTMQHASAGCDWCQLLLDGIMPRNRKARVDEKLVHRFLRVAVGLQDTKEMTPTGVQRLVVIEGTSNIIFRRGLQTSASESANYMYLLNIILIT